jgi:hypothetical protein
MPGIFVRSTPKMQIHLIQRLLHVVDVGRGHLHPTLAMPRQRSYGADFLLRSIRRPQESNGVQELQPLTVGYVGAPARNVLYMGCIDQAYLEAALFQTWNSGIQ